MEITRAKIKFKYKPTQSQWIVEPSKTKFTNYFLALTNARNQASSKSGELHIYTETGQLKEILKFYS